MKNNINKHNYKFIKSLFNTWHKYIKFKLNYKYKLYGRISALDVEAVKKMVRKERGNRSTLLEHTLSVLFEFTGRSNYRRFSIFDEQTEGYFLTETSSYYYDSIVEAVNSNNLDTISFHKTCMVNSNRFRDRYLSDDDDDKDHEYSKYKDRIERKEKQTLRILRFLLKQGCNPNNEIFIKNLILKHKYHCKTFFLKLLEMCHNYGLNPNFLLKIIRTTTTRFEVSYYIRPVLNDIHKNRLSVEDTINLCIGWASKKNFVYTLMNYGKGDLDILNDDVVGVITSFIYFV